MASGGENVCYVTTDGETIHSLSIPAQVTVKQFIEAIRILLKIDSDLKIEALDYRGGYLQQDSSLLAFNEPDTPYYVHVLSVNTTPDEDFLEEARMDLAALENRVIAFEEAYKNKKEDKCFFEIARQEFRKLNAKLFNRNYVNKLNSNKDASVAQRKLKYRRLSDFKQKEVREKFLQICNESLSDEVLRCLRLPSFDCCDWSDEYILLLLQDMYLHFELDVRYKINIDTLRNFLFQVYKNYNEVPFHNFRHSFCVTQMMYAMLVETDMVKLIGHMEVLVLITSCICHDLDHPGYNNIYQINARTELAIRYNDISPLENHHCSMAFRILELPDCNIFENLPEEVFRVIREGMIRCILATDMARHNEILSQFKDALAEGFNFDNRTHINLLCMILIKVADISNEARPMNVAEPWLDRLFKEFFCQSDAEKKEGLPVTPFMDRDKVTKPSSQCSFIGFVLLPLFESLGKLFPELDEMIVQPVRDALEYYRRLNEEQRQQRKSVVTLDTAPSTAATTPLTPPGSTPTHGLLKQKSEENSTLSEDILQSFDDLTEEEEETVTEVAVSEKTLKFKISTESSCGLRSNPGSRKGSREKSGQDIGGYRTGQWRVQTDSIEKRSTSSGENNTLSSDDRKGFSSEQGTVSGVSVSSSIAGTSSASLLQRSPAAAVDKGKKVVVTGKDVEHLKSQSTRSPDLKRIMNKVVNIRGGKSKVGNGVKAAEEAGKSTGSSSSSTSTSKKEQHKEHKSPGWVISFLQNIRLKGGSTHDSPSTTDGPNAS